MFKIGEFSRLTQVSVRMLRYYDETGLLKPAHIDPWTGYRLYAAAQIPRLNKILYLRDSGFNVAEIAAALAGAGDAALARQLAGKRAEIEKQIEERHEQLQKIALAQQSLVQGRDEMHDQVLLKAVPGCPVLSLRRVIPDYYAEGDLWKELAAFARRQGVPVSGETFSLYHDPDYRERDVDVELCARVEKLGQSAAGFTYRVTPPVPLMACTMVYGPFSGIAGAYQAFAAWLEAHSQNRMGGPSRQIVHRGPWNEQDSQDYLVELQIPLEKSETPCAHTTV